ncbi:hypothetical protein F0562_021167 [Nyssa sinensis]|uniref:Uncharacterized protein n=1 Tax=Nyssa sinensis TaxID=561372 RepID=A0A5J5BL10_9ASTE|nr:hypothetical protein F0562_021167 [Nyssa sinensis]
MYRTMNFFIKTSKVILIILIFFIVIAIARPLEDVKPTALDQDAKSVSFNKAPVPPTGPSPCTHIPRHGGGDKPATAVANLGAATEMQTAELLLNHKDEINNSMTAVGHLEIARENDSMNEYVSAASKFPSSLEMESSMGKLLFSVQPFETFLQPDDLTSKAMATVQQQCSIADETTDKSLCSVQRLQTSSLTTINKSLPDSIDTVGRGRTKEEDVDVKKRRRRRGRKMR